MKDEGYQQVQDPYLSMQQYEQYQNLLSRGMRHSHTKNNTLINVILFLSERKEKEETTLRAQRYNLLYPYPLVCIQP